ncbi:hypothetical protein BN439_3818 [Erwinia amylovora Ea644]|nr:hypothetical protein BN439_3818 [Erwinia amylovora Ea644]
MQATNAAIYSIKQRLNYHRFIAFWACLANLSAL